VGEVKEKGTAISSSTSRDEWGLARGSAAAGLSCHWGSSVVAGDAAAAAADDDDEPVAADPLSAATPAVVSAGFFCADGLAVVVMGAEVRGVAVLEADAGPSGGAGGGGAGPGNRFFFALPGTLRTRAAPPPPPSPPSPSLPLAALPFLGFVAVVGRPNATCPAGLGLLFFGLFFGISPPAAALNRRRGSNGSTTWKESRRDPPPIAPLASSSNDAPAVLSFRY